ncbi:MAG: hypothetical protein VYA51_13010 [Planctomycetota bacterium]|nr:hypothetical protein [Planctomycetota bacterium]
MDIDEMSPHQRAVHYCDALIGALLDLPGCKTLADGRTLSPIGSAWLVRSVKLIRHEMLIEMGEASR